MCTTSPHLEVYLKFLQIAVDSLFTEQKTRVIQKLYHTLNKLNEKLVIYVSPQEKAINRYISATQSLQDRNKLSRRYQINFNEIDTSLVLDQSRDIFDLLDFNIKPLLQKIGTSIMHVYDAIVKGKRIILYGEHLSVLELSKSSLAIANLLAPALPEVIKFHLYPYAYLPEDVHFLSSFYIAGVKNPIFRLNSH